MKLNFRLRDLLFTLGTLVASFLLNLMLQNWFHSRTMVPMVFVLAVFLISWQTEGYFWGITSSLFGVLVVNYAFTQPFFAFDWITPECVTSAVVMLIVSILTGMLTTRIKHQEQIRMEIASERMRGNLLRAVGHDLRTPLTGIYGASSAVLENYHDLTDEQKLSLLRSVREDSQWLIRMVENLLSVTRMETDQVRLIKTPTVLEEFVDAVLMRFRKYFPEQTIHVSIPEEFVSIPMDAVLMEQVMINLLENAVVHGKGMQKLAWTVRCVDGWAEFTVEDDGCGISPERMRTLFHVQPENDVPADAKRRNMGIGLSVCASIVKAHGSEVVVENRYPRGAIFRFSLKMEEEDEYESV